MTNCNRIRNWKKDGIAGVGAGLWTAIVWAPLDMIRTQILVRNLFVGRAKYSGTAKIIAEIYQKESIKGFYKGFQLTVILVPMIWGIYFPVFKKTKEKLFDFSLATQSIVSASFASISALVIANPLQMVRVRMQTQIKQGTKTPLSVLQMVKKIYREEGIKSFYQGLNASLFGVLNVSWQFAIYDQFKNRFMQENEKPSVAQIALMSTVSKTIASILLYPHDVIRTELYILNKSKEKRFSGFFSIIGYMLKTEGIRGFYCGLSANLMKVVPSTCINLVAYEKISYCLQHIN